MNTGAGTAMIKTSHGQNVRRVLMGWVFAASALLAVGALSAEDAPSPGAVRQSVQPQRPVTPKAPEQTQSEKPVADPLAGVPEGGTRIRINRFEITGNKIVPLAELHALVASYEGSDLTLFQIYELADGITRYYRNKGYTVASCNVPEQRISSGVVRLEIIEGVIGEVRIEGNKWYRTNTLLSGIDQIETGTVLTEDALRKQLDPLNELPGLRAQAVIQPGSNYGESAVVFRVTEDPISGAVRFNNHGRKSIGELRFEGDLALNSVYGFGERFDLSVVQAEENLLNYVSAGFSLPMPGNLRTRFATYYSHYDYRIAGKAGATLGLNGSGENYGLSANHRATRGDATLTWGIGFDRTTTTLVTGPLLSEHRFLNLLQASASYSRSHGSDAFTFLNGTISSNFRSNHRDPVTLQPENDAQAFKVRFDLGHYRKLTENWLLLFRATAVGSIQPLVDTEQFRIGGPDSVRADASSEIGGDYGFAFSFEVQRPIPWFPVVPARFSLFTDFGKVYRYEAALLKEAKSDTISGVGSGLELRVFDNATINIAVARRLGTRRAVDGRDDYRIWAGMNVNF